MFYDFCHTIFFLFERNSNATEVFHNEVHGYLFRSKTVNTNEGGLMSGTAALDTIILV